MSHNPLKNGVILFLISLLVRITYIFLFVESDHLVAEDQALYIQLAQNFPNSGFLGVPTERVPGYPFFISVVYNLFGESIWNVVLVQVILDSISCVVVALMANILFDRGFWIAGILSALNLNMVILSASLLTDTLFLFLFTLFLFSILQYLQNTHARWLILLALFISLATLVRPSSYYLLPILLIGLVSWRLWHKDTILKIGVLSVFYIVIVVVILGGVHQRNYQQYGSTALVSQTGAHLLSWVVPASYQYSGQGSYQKGQKLAREKLVSVLKQDQLDVLPTNPFVSSSYRANVGKSILFELGFLNVLKAWTVGSVINLLMPSVAYAPALRSIKHPSFYGTKGSGIVEKLFNYINNSNGLFYLSFLIVGTIISIIFMTLALAGVFKMILELQPVIVVVLILLIFYFLTITGPIIGVKYRLPVDPILTLFATYFIRKIYFKIWKQ